MKENIEDLDVRETENTETIIEDFIDEFCSEEEYKKEVEDNFEIFQVTTKQFPEESGKNEISNKSDQEKLILKLSTI